MRYLASAVHMKPLHGRDALVLAQMLHPQFNDERFEDASLYYRERRAAERHERHRRGWSRACRVAHLAPLRDWANSI